MKIRRRGLRSPRRKIQWRRPEWLDVARWTLLAGELLGVVLVWTMLFILAVVVLAERWTGMLIPAMVLLVGGAALALFCPLAVDEVAMWQRRRKARGDDDQA